MSAQHIGEASNRALVERRVLELEVDLGTKLGMLISHRAVPVLHMRYQHARGRMATGTRRT
jgi:hypothetical protein